MIIKKPITIAKRIATSLLVSFIFLFIITGNIVLAQEPNVKLCWEYPIDDEASIDGYNIYYSKFEMTEFLKISAKYKESYKDVIKVIKVLDRTKRCKDIFLPGGHFVAMTVFRFAQKPIYPFRRLDNSVIDFTVNKTEGWQKVSFNQELFTHKFRLNEGDRFWIAFQLYNPNAGVVPAKIAYKLTTNAEDRRVISNSSYIGAPLYFGSESKSYLTIRSVKYDFVGVSAQTQVLGNVDIFTKRATANRLTAVPYVASEYGTIKNVSIYHTGDASGTGKGTVAIYSDGQENVFADESDFSNEIKIVFIAAPVNLIKK